MDNRKYFDYELAYECYKKAEKLFNKGGIKALLDSEKFDNPNEDLEDNNGYLCFYDSGSDTGTGIYLTDRNFDNPKEDIEKDWYVSGEVDMVSYGGGDDNLFINSLETIINRQLNLQKYAKENNYTINDYEQEMISLQNVEQLLLKNENYGEDDKNV